MILAMQAALAAHQMIFPLSEGVSVPFSGVLAPSFSSDSGLADPVLFDPILPVSNAIGQSSMRRVCPSLTPR